MSTQCPYFHEEWIGVPGDRFHEHSPHHAAQVTIKQWCNREESPWPRNRLGCTDPLLCHGDLEQCPLH